MRGFAVVTGNGAFVGIYRERASADQIARRAKADAGEIVVEMCEIGEVEIAEETAAMYRDRCSHMTADRDRLVEEINRLKSLLRDERKQRR